MILDRTGEAIGQKTIKINDKDVKIKVNVGDIRNYLIKITELKKEGNTPAIVNYQFEFIEKLLKQGNPTVPVEEIKADVEFFFGDLVKEVSIALRLATREDYEIKEKAKN